MQTQPQAAHSLPFPRSPPAVHLAVDELRRIHGSLESSTTSPWPPASLRGLRLHQRWSCLHPCVSVSFPSPSLYTMNAFVYIVVLCVHDNVCLGYNYNFVCVLIHEVFAYTYTYIHTYIHTNTHTCVHIHMCVFVCMYACVCIYKCMHVFCVCMN